LLYGYIDTRSKPPRLILNYWISPQDKYKFEDIRGRTQIGEPIRVVNLSDPGISVQRELEQQSTAAAWIAIGLAHEQLGQTEAALQAFLKAKEDAPTSEMVQFFVGRAQLFLSEAQPDRQEELWQEAEAALLQSITLNDGYARAYIALGALYMKRAEVLVEVALASEPPVDPQAAQWVEQAMASYRKVLELKPDPEHYGNPVEDVARLGLGNAYRLKGVISVIDSDLDSALTAFDESIPLLETSRPVFETEAAEHESYRRYLAQTYEYLGSAYRWQGIAFETAQMYDEALIAYQKSIEGFGQCIAQGDVSVDLVIQRDIVEKICQPNLEETQQMYNELTGGQ
jgi:tetratricopeptide (TPR) repeat protein